MTQIVLDFAPSALSALRKSPADFAAEVKMAAVVQWYAEGKISQSKACEIVNVSRETFLQELHQRRVPACQVTLDEVREELQGV